MGCCTGGDESCSEVQQNGKKVLVLDAEGIYKGSGFCPAGTHVDSDGSKKCFDSANNTVSESRTASGGKFNWKCQDHFTSLKVPTLDSVPNFLTNIGTI